MNQAMDKGYSIIRICQEDIYNDKNNWVSKTKKVIQSYKEPEVICIGCKIKYQKYNDLKIIDITDNNMITDIETKINDEVVNKQPKTEIKKSKSDIIEKKHKCDKCKIAFKHKYQLTNHEKTEKHKTGRRQKKKNIVKKEYKCTICNIYSTKQPTNYKLHILNNHKTTEEKEKKFPHYCKLCDFGSFEKSKYDKHILTKKHKIASEAIKNK